MKKIISLVFLLVSIVIFEAPALAEPNESFFSSQKKVDSDGVEIYSTNSELKSYKKLGGGLAIGGEFGLAGAFAELNLDQEFALRLGLGAGQSYGTFSFAVKKNFEAQYLSPFTKVGYSKWYSTSGNDADNSSVLSQIYSKEDLRNRNFGADFLVGSFGVEYNQLEGELSGLNLIGEVTLLAELKKSQIVPTGSVGVVYFY